jgi:hypothetical protein
MVADGGDESQSYYEPQHGRGVGYLGAYDVRNMTYSQRRLIVAVPLALLALWIVMSLGSRQAVADGSGMQGESTSSAPSSSAPAVPRQSRDTDPRSGLQVEYGYELQCEGEGCSAVAAPVPCGVAAGRGVVPEGGSPECAAAGPVAPRRGVNVQCPSLPGTSR